MIQSSDSNEGGATGEKRVEGGERPSKTQRKKEMHALQSLGQQLVGLSRDQLARVELPDELREAIDFAHRVTSHEGRRRHMQYIGKLMRHVDPEPIKEAVAAFKLGHAKDSLALHQSERWRERLLAEDAALQEFIEQHGGIDVQQLRSLVRDARKDATNAPEQRSGRAFRELFQFIKAEQLRTEPRSDE